MLAVIDRLHNPVTTLPLSCFGHISLVAGSLNTTVSCNFNFILPNVASVRGLPRIWSIGNKFDVGPHMPDGLVVILQLGINQRGIKMALRPHRIRSSTQTS